MNKSQINNDLNGGLWLASIEENQIPGTWSFLLNGVVETEDHENFGIASEPSLELVAALPEGFVPRGDVLIPDRNQILAFSYNQSTGVSEIGIMDLLKKEYVTYINDSKFTQKLNFGVSRKIKPKFFVKGECREHHVVFSACSIYYVLNISKSFCDVTYEDMLLLPCDCGPIATLREVEKGGLDLPGGKYYVAAALSDEDDNDTNFFWVSDPLILNSPNQIPGEISENSISITIEGNRSENFEFIKLAVIRNIGFDISVKLLPKIPFTKTKQHVLLSSEKQYSALPITIDDIKKKDIGWIRGNGIDIEDGRAILHNTYGEPNFDILKYSRKVKLGWFAKLCPLSEAHKYPSLARDEVYSPGLSKIWCDGFYSRYGTMPGRRATVYDREKIPVGDPRNCSSCEVERWQVENTASVTAWYCGNPYENSEDSHVNSLVQRIDKDETADPNKGCPAGRHCRPGSVSQGHAIKGTCSATCSRSCGSIGCCKNGICQNCGASCKGCSNCGGSSCQGNCSGSCNGGNPSDRGYYNTGTEQIQLNVCDVVITYNKTPNCPACDDFDASGVWGQIAAALPQYTVHLVVIDRDPEHFIDISFEFDCISGNSFIVGRTLNDFVTAISGFCECNAEPDETYDCQPTGCEKAGQNGEWRSYQACYDNCSPERSLPWKCDTVTGNCIQAVDGLYSTLFECSKFCDKENFTKYNCVSGTCVGDVAGTYNSLLSCRADCENQEALAFKCTTQGCIPDDLGEFPTYLDCLAGCKPSDPGGNCGGCGTDCPEHGCIPTPEKDPGWYAEDSNTCIILNWGANNPWESVDAKEAMKCINNKCPELDTLFGKKWTVPWELDGELDLKKLIIKKRDGTIVKINEHPVYKPPVYKFERGTTQTLLGKLNQKICEPVPIYDKKGCNIIGYDLPIFAEGECGYWESTETYPTDKDCNGNFLWGEDAGMPIRLPLMPDESIIPHYISFQNGVPHRMDPANLESNDCYVLLLGLRVTGIEQVAKEDIIKPGCNNKQWKIGIEPRDDSNSRVIAKGYLVACFEAELHGQIYLHPNHGVNSLEKFSPFIKWQRDPSNIPGRGGQTSSVPGYVFFSPDTHYAKPVLNISQIKCPLEIFGQGHRYGTSSKMSEPDSYFARYYNRKGCRQSIHLNHYDRSNSKKLVEPGSCQLEGHASLEIEVLSFHNNPVKFYRSFEVDIYNVDLTKSSIELKDSKGNTLTLPYTNTYRDEVSIANLKFGGIYVVYVTFNIVTLEGCIYKAIIKVELKVSNDVDGTIYREDISFFAQNRKDPKWEDIPAIFCVKSAVYAPANKIINKEDRFTYSLMNRFRESSVYLELQPGNFPTLKHGIDSFLADGKYNGESRWGRSEGLDMNGTSDFSFMGDGYYHEAEIYNASAHYAVLLRNIPDQYGRIENAKYADLHILTDTESICGDVNMLNGDVYIGQYSTKRHSVVSDRVGDDVTDGGAFEEWFGVNDCGDPPKSGENVSRNHAVLRQGDPWNGRDRFDGFTNEDNYWPGVLTSNNTICVETKVNLKSRILGNELPPYNEIYYPELKGQELDVRFPDGTEQEASWLSRFYWSIVGMSKADKLIMWANTIFKLFVLPIIMYSLLSGINLSSVVGYVMLGIAIAFYVAFIAFNTNVKLMIILGIDSCLNDQDGGPKMGGIKGFHDLHNKYNWSKSFTTLWYNYGVPLGYNICKCLGDLSGKVYWGNKQRVSSKGDAFRRYKINNYIDLDANYGLLQNIIHWGHRMWFQTTDSIKNVRFGEATIDISNGDKARLGTGDFLGVPYDEFGSIPEGKAGTIDPAASITSEWGHMYVDGKACTFNNWTGQNTEISSKGVRAFLKNNLRIFIREDFPEYPGISEGYNVGFSMGVDHRFRRILLTKKDWKCKAPEKLNLVNDRFYKKDGTGVVALGDPDWFENRSFSISYYIGEEKRFFVGFHSYLPDYYTWDRKYMYSWSEGKLWKHADNRDSYLKFYDLHFPFIIEIIAREFQTKYSRGFEYVGTKVGVKNLIWDDQASIWRKADKFFDYIGILNSHQSSGLVKTIVQKNPTSQEYQEIPVISYNSMQYEFHQIRNLIPEGKEISDVLEKVNRVLPNMLKELVRFDKSFGDYNNNLFLDEYLKYRFVRINLDETVQTILRYVLTKITTPTDSET